MVTIPEREPYIQKLENNRFQPYIKEIAMLRLDIIHPVVSGNKWYKLKHNIDKAVKEGYKGILTFGGAYSNHLVAAAAAAKAYDLPSVGIVRGTYAAGKLTSTLASCKEYDMQLAFVSREEYDKKNDKEWLQELMERFPQYYVIPEGGANDMGKKGAGEIASFIPGDYTHVCVSVGSGTSLVGIRNSLDAKQHIYGYVPMKNGSYMANLMKPDIRTGMDNIKLFDKWHFGGFGKWNKELLDFMNEFYETSHIPLDIVYTGKMMYGIYEQITSRTFPIDARILCIHTGGLQGNTSVANLLKY